MGRHRYDSHLDEWAATWREQNPDAWLAPLRTGGTRTERRIRQTLAQRGLLLVKRAGRRALRLRRALVKGGR
ncbi:hypothetical protein FHS43_006225 [Streptosporangium becharense]|uniref:Uncharacterized protein n=1 Tax=Streptosporangium becharense TaxID=1816182 RepID=A0A7W9IGS7_9ACTN|nr:hypothetical protein [Streptosporangium becharense]MBB2914913.1 hypothetical protein [Streptosporangium becharense]MBB5820276.1 hypothetical protein [Streptosporangium becharense]